MVTVEQNVRHFNIPGKLIASCLLGKMEPNGRKRLHFGIYALMKDTANVYTQTTDLLLFSDVVITHENV